MAHEEFSALLAPFALDAVVGDECRALEEHLEDCPRCRADLDAFRDVAAALGNSVAPLPEGLWLSIESRLGHAEDEPAAMPRLFSGSTAFATPRRHRRVSTRARFAVVGSILGAAAAAAAILGFGLNQANDGASQVQAAPASQATGVVAALEAPGHRVVNMDNGSASTLAQFVMADGRGYLVSSTLPVLKSSETYQLWGVVSGQPISLGLLGQSPSNSIFTLAGSVVPTQLRITVEPSSGSVVPSGAVVASGLV
ncbi:MAG TPA: anti-sigma factor [Acidimicrobiales bacterium]